jgi:hypothetical protein
MVLILNPDQLRREFLRPDSTPHIENLSGSYPYETCARGDVGHGSIFAVHTSRPEGAKRIYTATHFGSALPALKFYEHD